MHDVDLKEAEQNALGEQALAQLEAKLAAPQISNSESIPDPVAARTSDPLKIKR